MTIAENSRKVFDAKQEGDTDTINKIEKFSKAPSTSRQWSAFRNPRIVRVSRAFGGKDRHSKVCTIRGLRDRRIRLSVPTAIQLYDLQERLGLNQPSKVIDWLLEATKLDIDKLPPLQIPQGFAQFHHPQTLFPHHQNHHESTHASQFSLLGGGSFFEKGKWIKTNNELQENQVSAQKVFPIGTSHHSSLPGLLNNNAVAYNNSDHLEPSSNLSLSQFGSHGGVFASSQVDPHPSSGNVSVQFPSSGSQLLFCASNSATPSSLFTTPYAPFLAESDPRLVQFNHNHNIQFLCSSNSQQVLPHPHHHHHPLNIPSLHSINSPLRPFLPPPFNSKLFDSDKGSNRS